MAPALAWPTILLPFEYALGSQFLAFIYLYYADATATTRGWTPPWYQTYRFVLTFLAGAAIVVSLIGRGEIGANDQRRLPSTIERKNSENKGEYLRAKHEGLKVEIMEENSK